MTDILTQEIGGLNVTAATDWELALALNNSLNIMDADRTMNGFSDIRNASLEERIANLESALLALATVVSRRLGL